MTYLVVPLEASQDSATIWVGVVGEAHDQLSLRAGDMPAIPVPDQADSWTTFPSSDPRSVWTQRITLSGLEPARRYPVTLSDGQTDLATATAITLPTALPMLDQRPFTVLLGSCFAVERDGAGAAGAAFATLPSAARPDVKFLCGDQVYLDAPAGKFLMSLRRGRGLETDLLSTYVSTWGQGGDLSGFRAILQWGAAFLSSDDHEFWNNAPSKTPLVVNTWLGGWRNEYLTAAQDLYKGFQASKPSATFTVGKLAFRMIDTRLARTSDQKCLVPDGEIDDLRTWVDTLAGPGVLVLGQPVFQDKAGLKGFFFDWGLPDFGQFEEMVRIIQNARHDIVVMTGDVHFGRVAWCRLPTGRRLLEVISSPFALVDDRAGGTWHQPPGQFPSFPVAGATGCQIFFEDHHRLAANQFATIEFSDSGGRVRMAVRSWPIPNPGTAATSTIVFNEDLD